MERTLEGRTALVTGSTSGIGLGIALLYAQAGAKVMLNGLGRPDDIARARREVGAAMGVEEAPFSDADLSRGEAVAGMVRAAEAALGSVDILVNNAGIQHVAPIDEFPEAKWDAIIAINFSSNFHAIKAALPGMKRRNWGRIINVASAHGLVASPYKAAYVSAKHAVVGLTKTVALEIARTPITCNAVCPGFVRTPLAEAQVGPLAEKHGVSEGSGADRLLAGEAALQALGRGGGRGAHGALPRRPRQRRGERRGALHRRRLAGGLMADRELPDVPAPAAAREAVDAPRRRPDRRRTPPSRPRRGASTSRCKAAARTAPSPGACWSGCWRTTGST
jgi:3-hydroxybutyrate dehydrogenase